MQPAQAEALPIRTLDFAKLAAFLGRANRALGHYDGILAALANPEIPLSPLFTQEAVMSSRIEGTQATLGEVLRFEAGQSPDRHALEVDVREILNYRRALHEAVADLHRRPFGLNLLRRMHATLLDSVRGNDKSRGEFRRTQNWIGRDGTPIEAADFVPPPPSRLPPDLDAWERYYHAGEPDALLQLAVLHAQFEFLHPFLDGNGRIGRLLVPLFLYEKKLLSRPAFYLSQYLEGHRNEYYARLRALGREPEAWLAWCKFFLTAVAAQAEENSRKVRNILELYAELKNRAMAVVQSRYTVPVLDAIFEHVFFNTSQLVGRPNFPSRQALIKLLRKLADHKVLEVAVPPAGRRPMIVACPELLAICESQAPEAGAT